MSLDFRELRTVRQIAEQNPALPLGTVKTWMNQRERNGLQEAVVRIGRKTLIHLPTFNAWLARHLETSAQPSSRRAG